MSKIRNEDLVLKVSRNINPQVWDEGRYDAFVDTLCQGREYQKEAIFTALRFLAGGQYRDLRALTRENFDGNNNFCFFADLFQTTIIKPENLFQQNTPSEVGVTTCTQDELHTSLILKIKMALYKYFGCKTA